MVFVLLRRSSFAHIAAGVTKRFIPWQMGVAAKLLRLLPYRLYFPLVRKLTGL